jgi:hypothetical protein
MRAMCKTRVTWDCQDKMLLCPDETTKEKEKLLDQHGRCFRRWLKTQSGKSIEIKELHKMRMKNQKRQFNL